MKYPFAITLDGVELTFEKVGCRRDWRGKVETRTCSHFRWMGQNSSQKHFSQRVGICPHLGQEVDDKWIREWCYDEDVRQHIYNIREREWNRVDQSDIEEELHPHKDDKVWRTQFGKKKGTYNIKVEGLTREDAINLYKMIDSIRAEHEDA